MADADRTCGAHHHRDAEQPLDAGQTRPGRMDSQVQRPFPEHVDAGQPRIDIDEDARNDTVAPGTQPDRQAEQGGQSIHRTTPVRWQTPVRREVLPRSPATLEAHETGHLDELVGAQPPNAVVQQVTGSPPVGRTTP